MPYTESSGGYGSGYTTAPAAQIPSYRHQQPQYQQPQYQQPQYQQPQYQSSAYNAQPSPVQSISAGQGQSGNPQIPITQNITAQDTLEPGYKRLEGKDRIKAFFVPGRVFYILWSEPAGQMPSESPVTGMSGAFTVVSFNEYTYTEIRRFLVIKAASHHSLCLPIATYRQYGTSRRHDAKDHSIIYTDKEPNPLQGENLNKRAIKVDPEAGETLDETSRLNYSQTYTVQHNVKVKKLGKVTKDHMAYVKLYWKAALGLD